jgi:hypothetical protein
MNIGHFEEGRGPIEKCNIVRKRKAKDGTHTGKHIYAYIWSTKTVHN